MDEQLTTDKSFEIIQQMINKAKNSFHETGIGPMLWGSVITLCSLVTFFQLQFDFKLPVDIWLLTIVAIAPQIYLVAKEKKLNKARSHDDTVMDYVWSCFGIGIFLLIFIDNIMLYRIRPVFETYIELKGVRPEYNVSGFLTSYFLLLYGFPTIITGGFRKFKPMLYGGIFCWVCCIVSVFTPVKIDMLLTALSATFAWLIPGIILWNRYQKRKALDV